jgi:hypothetical protein
MKYEEIHGAYRTEYAQNCPCCSDINKVLTQAGNDPEYDAYVYIQCKCGQWIEFILPVN